MIPIMSKIGTSKKNVASLDTQPVIEAPLIKSKPLSVFLIEGAYFDENTQFSDLLRYLKEPAIYAVFPKNNNQPLGRVYIRDLKGKETYSVRDYYLSFHSTGGGEMNTEGFIRTVSKIKKENSNLSVSIRVIEEYIGALFCEDKINWDTFISHTIPLRLSGEEHLISHSLRKEDYKEFFGNCF
jgi:hypothetical protein